MFFQISRGENGNRQRPASCLQRMADRTLYGQQCEFHAGRSQSVFNILWILRTENQAGKDTETSFSAGGERTDLSGI